MSILSIFLPERGASEAMGAGSTAWLIDVFARKTASGETVTPSKAMSLSAYFACLRVISEDVAKVPLRIHRKLPTRGSEIVHDDPVDDLVHLMPNPEISAYVFRETLTQWAAGWGAGCAEIVRDGTGQPRQLWPIHPSRLTLERRPDGDLQWLVRSSLSELGHRSERDLLVPIAWADMFHIRGMGTDLRGYSVVGHAAESLGIALAAQTFAASFFANGSQSGGILEHPGQLGPEALDRLKKSWAQQYGGAKNANRVKVLEEGMKFTTTTIPPNEAQFLETRHFQVEEVCRWFRVAPHKIQHLLRSTFGNIEHQSIEHNGDTLLPWFLRWETEIKIKLIGAEQRDLFAKHTVNGLMRGDATARSAYYRTMLNLGALSPNDIRDLEDLNPIPNPAGDAYFMQSNMAGLDAVANGTVRTTTAAPREAERDAAELARAMVIGMRPMIATAVDRILRKEAMAVQRHAGKSAVSWVNAFYAELVENLVEVVRPINQSISTTIENVTGTAPEEVDSVAWSIAWCNAAIESIDKTGAVPADHAPLAMADAIIAAHSLEP